MLVLTACSNGPEVDPKDPTDPTSQTGQTDTGQKLEPQEYTQEITLSSKGSEQNITLSQLQTVIVTATVETDVTWLTVEILAYTSGSPQVKLRSIHNYAKEERKCSVTITATSGDKVILSVKQEGGYEGTEIDDLHGSQTDKPAYRRK